MMLNRNRHEDERVAIEREGEETYGGGSSGKVRTVRRTTRGSAAGSGSAIPVDSTSK
jgi:hypothetical protein